jgi:hypothetical protein
MVWWTQPQEIADSAGKGTGRWRLTARSDEGGGGPYGDTSHDHATSETAQSEVRVKYTEIHRRSLARAARALELRRQGLTFREIGAAMGGVTVETARQAVKKGERIERRRAQRT